MADPGKLFDDGDDEYEIVKLQSSMLVFTSNLMMSSMIENLESQYSIFSSISVKKLQF